MESIHQKLERFRKPRVHIKYEIETEDSIVTKELPFVVGIMGDFSGDPIAPLKPFKERKFVQIDRDNFDNVMKQMTPGLNFTVENKIKNDHSEMQIQLEFNSLNDFGPAHIVEQVPALKKLLDTRNKLRDLLTKADCSEELETLLEKTLQDNTQLQALSEELRSNPSHKEEK